MAPPPRLLQFLAVLLSLSVLLLAVSGVHGTRHQQLADAGGDGEHQRRAGIGIGEMPRWCRWSRTVVVIRKGGGGHGNGGHGHGRCRRHGRGRGHGTPGTPAVFYPRTVTGGHPRRSAAAAATGRPSARALLVAAATAVLLLLLLRL